jgi:hypothetical protein
MKLAAIGIFALLIAGTTAADAGSANKSLWRVADAATACFISCASQNDSCKRMCPTTFNGTCIGACDNQAQFCRQSCQQK